MVGDYVTAWALYLGAASLLLMVGWRMTRRLRHEWRQLVRLVAASLLLTPAPVASATGSLAPASIMLLLASVVGDTGAAHLAWYWLTASLLGVLLVSLLLEVTRRRRAAGRAEG